MSRILFINACVRPNSRTFELTKTVLSKLKGAVEQVNLYDLPLKALDLEGMEKRDVAAKTKCFDDEFFDLAKQFSEAETIVVAAPYWDLMFPAVVKSYFETITVNGLTFVYGENGIPKGLCKAKELIYVTTSGGPIFQNFGFEYVSALAKSFYGIETIKLISAQGLDIKGADVDSIMNKAKESIADIL